MAKTLKTNKKDFLTLLNIVDRIPSAMLSSDVGKLLDFRRAIKKALREFLDSRSDIIKRFESNKALVLANLRTLQEQMLTATTEEEKTQLELQHQTLTQELNREVDKGNADIASLIEALTSEDIEITFDNEDANFIEKTIRENAVDIFKSGEAFDADMAERIFDLLDSIK